MKMSKIGIKTRHHRGSDEALSQEILFQSTQLKRHAAGIYGLGNLLVRARNNIINIIRYHLESYECAEVSLPIIQPKSLWESSGRWNVYADSKQMFTFSGRNGDYCLAPTGEEIVLDFIRENIVSYKDLPVNIFQIGNKYRDEIRVRGGLLRSKEFIMKDGYSFHAGEEDMVREYNSMRECYMKIFSDLGLDVIAVKAISAEMGGKVSEEFMCISDIGEDKVLMDSENNIALNTEVLEHPDILNDIKESNPNFDLDNLKEVACIELGHIFQLGKFYSESMNGYYTNSEGKKEAYHMGCYGIGVNRTLGAICENNCDENGLIWPESIAPYKCVIVPAAEFIKESEKLYSVLKDNNIDVVWDDRDITFGSKIKDAKLLGFPYMVIVGKKYAENNMFEMENRKTSEKHFLNADELISFLKKHKFA